MPNQNKTDDKTLPGFRLHGFEVLNWGTFHHSVWSLNMQGKNSLLTGDIGTGKSTLVDGITALLVPPAHITYNKAAGVDRKERTHRSYVQGYYKSEKDDDAFQAKSIALREKNDYSVLLAYFFNESCGQGITLAQVLWMKDNKGQPDRFYLIAGQRLSIAKDFTGFGNNVLDLKKRFRGKADIPVFDKFSEYAAEFRRRFNMQSRQALELFYQTVSMKSVGNLTDFVRNHMLDEPPVDERIAALCGNFSNLNLSHEAVLKAKAQIGLLTPLIADCDRYSLLENDVDNLRSCRDILYAYYADIKCGLLSKHIERLLGERDRIKDRIDRQNEDIRQMETRRDQIRKDIDNNGGTRLAELQREIDQLGLERKQKQELAARYAMLGKKIDIPAPESEDSFYANREILEKKLQSLETGNEETRKSQVDAQILLRQLNERHGEIGKEIASLRQRPSNIPLHNLDLRRRLCETLGISEDEVPYAGELIQVHENESEWEGAIERLLHNFGLSLLVPDELYTSVARYADQTDLRGRLVYFRVRESDTRGRIPHDAHALIHKIKIKHDSAYYSWIQSELADKFDYLCCETLDDFKRHKKAITKRGQFKSGAIKHEKDDRYNLHDRSRYVLGWQNESKIRALEERLTELRKQGLAQLDLVHKYENTLRNISEQRDAVRDVLNIASYSDICWQPLTGRIEDLCNEMKEIEEAADILRSLRGSLLKLEKELSGLGKKRDENTGKLAVTISGMEDSEKQLLEARETVEKPDAGRRGEYFPKLAVIRTEALGDRAITLQNCEKSQTEQREWLQRSIDNHDSRIKNLTEKIISRMQSYKNVYRAETSETSAELQSADEFRRMLENLSSEDLPRHEERFRRLLKEGTIQDIALFQSRMEKERFDIRKKIEAINLSLRDIEYNPGSYISICMEGSVDPEVREFQQDLRACLGDTLSGSDEDIYTESKFLQVKGIIDRFNGREGYVDLDKRWMKKVTDVRTWFIFSASERWLEDDTEKEFYSDSSGKSGGQKEKLAYTILAAALAFQYGLETGESGSRTFRFVMIDEAFGRGSDESARYGLELFKKLNLQLLIVTPLQKIHVIENYVKSVHFVYQKDNTSMVGSLEIEEYKRNKELYRNGQMPDTRLITGAGV